MSNPMTETTASGMWAIIGMVAAYLIVLLGVTVSMYGWQRASIGLVISMVGTALFYAFMLTFAFMLALLSGANR